MNDFLMPYLLEILDGNISGGVILCGGYGLYLKRDHLIRTGANTLMSELPVSRATTDLDFLLRLEVFSDLEVGKSIRARLDELQFEPKQPNWKFARPLNFGGGANELHVDLLARTPPPGSHIKVSTPRVGSRSNTGLHGIETPEAFAVEEQPVAIEVVGRDFNGNMQTRTVLTPHPYAWLNMKVRAAYDWFRWTHGLDEPREGRVRSDKHAFDAAQIAAMITEAELETATEIAAGYNADPLALEIRREAAELYSTIRSAGWQVAIRSDVRLEHNRIWPALSQALGIE
jgi:hypothetical protein